MYFGTLHVATFHETPPGSNFLRLLLAVLLAGLLTVSGCANPRLKGNVPASSYRLILGFDTSKSDRALLGDYARSAGDLIALLNSDRDELFAWRIDRSTQEMLIGRPSANKDAIKRKLIPLLRPVSTQDFTFTYTFWERVARRSMSGHSEHIVVFFSSGFTEGMDSDDHRRIQGAARKLAANRRLKAVCLVGVQPGNIEIARHQLSALGERLHIWPLEDAPSEFKRLLEAKGGAR